MGGIARLMVGVLLLAVGACGGGGSSQNSGSPSGKQATGTANVQDVKVYAGPAGNYANGLFTSVTVCVPGSTSNCQTIDGILLDTGSSGLRLLSSHAGGALTLPLPQINLSDGNPLAECAQYADLSYTWGSVQRADVRMAGEVAASVSVNVLGDPALPTIPSECAYVGYDSDNLQALGANGILGLGTYQQDCGGGCVSGTGAPPPASYYECIGGFYCQRTFVALDEQVQNPVTLFPQDNNGIIIRLPDVQAPQPSITGTLVFGIGTQSNNGLQGATVFPVNSAGNFSQRVDYNNNFYSNGFIDSGSNGNFFNGGIQSCQTRPFYCPATTQNLSASVEDNDNKSVPVPFSVRNADQLLADPNNFVLPGLAGPNPDPQGFDWGLPFFFGRSVYVAIEKQTTPGGTGPYWAW